MAIITGTSGNNNLTGTSSTDKITGKDGDDYIDGGAGADVISAGAGNDTVIYHSSDLLLDGGSGFDTLLVTGANQTINMTGISLPIIVGFEMIDIRGSGANTLNISAAGIVLETLLEKNSATNSYSTLMVRVNQDDTVNKGSGWTETAPVVVSGVLYHVYNQSLAKLLVEDRAPDAKNIAKSVNEDQLLNFNISAVDRDGDAVKYTPQDIVSAKGAHVVINTSGNMIYDASILGVQHLAAGAVVVDNIAYQTTDYISYKVGNTTLSVAGNSSTATIAVTLTGVNDAPLLAPLSSVGHPNIISTINENSATTGIQISSIIGNSITDVDDLPKKGIAVTSIDSHGQWYYSLDNINWTLVAGVSSSNALLLDESDYIKFVPSSGYNTGAPNVVLPSFAYQAWDETSGVIGGYGNAAVKGGASAFSLASDAASITVNPISNHAPVSANHTVTVEQNHPYIFTLNDFPFSDPNDTSADSLLAVKVDSFPPNGILQLRIEEFVYTQVTPGSYISVADIAAGNLTYTPNGGQTGIDYGNFSFQVQDDGGTANAGVDLSAVQTMIINVVFINHAPQAADKFISAVNEDNVPYVFTAADFGYSDSDGNALSNVIIDSLPTNGAIIYNGTVVNTVGFSISAAEINAGHVGFALLPSFTLNQTISSFTFSVQDNGGTANGGADTSASPNTITITAPTGNFLYDKFTTPIFQATVEEKVLFPDNSHIISGNVSSLGHEVLINQITDSLAGFLNFFSANQPFTGDQVVHLLIPEGEQYSFQVFKTGAVTDTFQLVPISTVFALTNPGLAPPNGATIDNNGMFTWTPTLSDVGKNYYFDVQTISGHDIFGAPIVSNSIAVKIDTYVPTPPNVSTIVLVPYDGEESSTVSDIGGNHGTVSNTALYVPTTVSVTPVNDQGSPPVSLIIGESTTVVTVPTSQLNTAATTIGTVTNTNIVIASINTHVTTSSHPGFSNINLDVVGSTSNTGADSSANQNILLNAFAPLDFTAIFH
jgi:VCBS repeat-containing protein